jgi:hypothetical protein
VTTVLEKLLNQGERKRDYLTFNLGVPGYNVSQELATLKEVGLKLSPDMVILNLCPNDSDPVFELFKSGLFKKADITDINDINVRTVVGTSYLLSYLKTALTKLLHSFDSELVSKFNDPHMIINPRVRESAWSDMKGTILEIREISAANGADFVLIFYPYKSQVDLPRGLLLPQVDLERFAGNNDIYFVDMVGTYRNTDESMFADSELHLSEFGAERVAETIENNLRAFQILGGHGRSISTH